MPRNPRSTPPGQHRPVMLNEVLEVLAVQPGQVVVDCTLGWAGHAVELLRLVGKDGLLIGLDMDPENVPRARQRLEEVGFPFAVHHANFASLPRVLAAENIVAVDAILADLGMSSIQVDDPERGFSYVRDGDLDMRMDRTRGKTAAQLLATLSKAELARALHELGDEPNAERIASAIVAARAKQPIVRTLQLAQLIQETVGRGTWRLHPGPRRWNLHPAARTFQALRLLVNRELANLQELLRLLPSCLRVEGRAAIISFHSGEDRLVKQAFRAGQQSGQYVQLSGELIRPSWEERASNPRARSAKLRWAKKFAPCLEREKVTNNE